RCYRDWSSDVCSSDLSRLARAEPTQLLGVGDQVDRHDSTAGGREANDRNRLPARCHDQAGGAVDDRRLGEARERSAAGENLTSEDRKSVVKGESRVQV